MPHSADILVVEDDKVFSDFLENLLGFNGYSIRLAHTGQEALKCISRRKADLVLLDVGLPDMDGRNVLKLIGADAPDTPVILMTGAASVESATKALQSGAYDYLAKPLEPSKLFKTIQNALDRNRIEKQRQKAVEKLGESEEKYHQLFDNIVDAVTIIDAKTSRFEDANKATLDLYGYSLEEFCKLTVGDISAEKEKTQNALNRLKHGEQGGGFVPVRYQQKKDGTIFPVEISVAAFESDGLKKYISSVRDITLRVEAQKEMLKTKSRMQHLLVSSPAVIYAAKPDTNSLSYISDNVKETLGYHWIDFIENPSFWEDCIHPDDAEGIMRDKSQLQHSENRVHEYRLKHADGNYRWLRDESRLIFDEHQHPIEVIGSWIDITDEKMAEQALRESEQRFRCLVENSLVGISIIQNDRFVYKNPAQQKMRDSFGQESLSDLINDIHPEDIDKVKAAYGKLIAGKTESIDVDIRFYAGDSSHQKANLRWAQCRATAISYRGEAAVLINIMDVTKAKELEQQLIIKNKMISLGRVAAGIAHEIRNPLTGINSYLYTLAEWCQSDSLELDDLEMMSPILDQIQTASNKIESVIKRVMDFSKPGAPKMEKTNINLALEEAIELSAVTLRKNGIKIESSLSPNLPRCYADPLLIEQVILNLITNAAKAFDAFNGLKLVGVDSYSASNTVFIRVSDSGPGIPPAHEEKIFDPFFTTNPEDSGIGLNIAQRIIADHNGSIALGKSKWGGAEFTIRLPIERRVYPR
jgi:PAS domain S-box-containing protein